MIETSLSLLFADDFQTFLDEDCEVNKGFVCWSLNGIVLEVNLGTEEGECLVDDVLLIGLAHELGSWSLDFCLDRADCDTTGCLNSFVRVVLTMVCHKTGLSLELL